MKIKNKTLILLFSIIMLMGLITGCAGSTEKVDTDNVVTGNEDTDTATENKDADSTALQDSSTEDANETPGDEAPMTGGQVTAIDGSNITLAVNPGGGMQNGKPEGGRPDGQDNTTENDSSEIKPEIPSSDTAPDDINTGEIEEKVITITDESIIRVEDGDTTRDGTLDDITVGCMLIVGYTTDETGSEVLSSVTVRNFSEGQSGQAGPGGQGEQDKADRNPSDNTTASENSNNE